MTVAAPHLASHVCPGMLVAPPRAQPSPSPALPQPWALGAEIPAPAVGSGRRSQRADSAMEPVETWTPGKVAAWLRGGWGLGSVGFEGHWDREK